MSVAQLLGHLRTGDVIILRGKETQSRPRRPSILERVDAVGGKTIESRKLLRSLIAVRMDGGKKK
ncbi:MAG: hypothetical protein GEU95_06050 [Rhizobiales bacterium]|nr:hypothetical protein [Hyphomicrobiales bacterium]